MKGIILFFTTIVTFLLFAQDNVPKLFMSTSYEFYEWQSFPIDDYNHTHSSDEYVSYFLLNNNYLNIFYQGRSGSEISEDDFSVIELINKKTRGNFIEYDYKSGSGKFFLDADDGFLGIYYGEKIDDQFPKLWEFPVKEISSSEIPQVINNLPDAALVFLEELRNTFFQENVLLYEEFEASSFYNEYEIDRSDEFNLGIKDGFYRLKVNRISFAGGQRQAINKIDSFDDFWISGNKDFDFEISYYLQRPSNSQVYIKFNANNDKNNAHVLRIGKGIADYNTLEEGKWGTSSSLKNDLNVKSRDKIIIKKRGYDYYFYLGDSYLGYKRITSRFGGQFEFGLLTYDDDYAPYVDFHYIKITEPND